MAVIGTDIIKAKELLEKGQVVAIPTETVYGLAGNALNSDAVIKIFTVKDRPHFDPLIVHVANLEQVFKLAEDFPGKARKLAEKFWPGPLTILLKRKSIIPDLVTSGLDTVGIRCPNHSLTLSLLKQLDFPLAAPSANPFGYISPTKASHVNDQLGDKINYILDGGECSIGIESTIVGFDNESAVIYRLGGLSIEKLESVIGKVKIDLNVSSNPIAPGQIKSHYAPRKKLVIADPKVYIKNNPGMRTAILWFHHQDTLVQGCKHLILTASGSMEEAAKNLFSMLRELDKSDADVIVAERVPDAGLGRAINDRLLRASS